VFRLRFRQLRRSMCSVMYIDDYPPLRGRELQRLLFWQWMQRQRRLALSEKQCQLSSRRSRELALEPAANCQQAKEVDVNLDLETESWRVAPSC
jgi:hypothetical protein